MGYHDRDYSGSGHQPDSGMDMFYRAMRVLMWSFPIGSIFRTSIRVHISFVILVLLRMLGEGDVVWTLRWTGLLFVSVLLHEFGHVLACRAVGGEADEIQMWPLGGLAMCRPPREPWADFVTTMWGPLVNVILAAAAFSALALIHGAGHTGVSFNPFHPWVVQDLQWGVSGVLQDLFVVNYMLLLFNLALLFYPFDGGRMVQAIIWARTDYRRSMAMVIPFGIGCAVIAALIGLAMNKSVLILIAVFGGLACYQQALLSRQEAELDSGGEGYLQFRESYDIGPQRARRKGWLARWREKRALLRAKHDADTAVKRAAEVDRILDKVSRQGLHSLTRSERRVLERETQQRRGG